MLTKILKILRITRRDFFHLNCLHSDHKYGKGGVAQMSTVFGFPYHVASPSVLFKVTFFKIHLNTFFGVRNFGNTSAMRVITFLLNVKNLI